MFTALERRSHEITAHHRYWRLLTSELVQDGGVQGAIYNLVTLAIIATFAGWFWGGPRSFSMFFLLGVAFDVVNVIGHQAGGGNSGATYGLGPTLVEWRERSLAAGESDARSANVSECAVPSGAAR